MRRMGAVVVAAVGLLAVSAVPAAAQTSVLDLPQMGFEIDTGQGSPGDVVEGVVDADDVAAACLSVDELVGNAVTEIDAALPDWEPPAGLSEEQAEVFAEAVQTLRVGVQTFPEIAEQLWSETFVFTFADIETQELLGDTGSFDPASGEGSIVVPELEPGTYALAAACVQIQSAAMLVDGGLDAGAEAFWAWVADNDIDVPDPDVIGEEWQAFVEESALEWVPELIDPRAVGIQLFCIDGPDEPCPDTAGDDLDTPPQTEPAPVGPAPVAAGPRFTG